MTKITRFEGDEKRSPDWPWWTLVEAVIWIVGEEQFEEAPAPASNASREEINAYWALNDGDLDWSAREWASRELHSALATGEITAYGLRSQSARPERLNPVDWSSREVPICDSPGLISWQYEPYYKVVVAKEEVLRRWPDPLNADAEPSGPSKRGRRKGVGGYARRDLPLVEEMHRMIASSEATSPYEAATKLLAQASGNGSDESKRKRLVDRYYSIHPKH